MIRLTYSTRPYSRLASVGVAIARQWPVPGESRQGQGRASTEQVETLGGQAGIKGLPLESIAGFARQSLPWLDSIRLRSHLLLGQLESKAGLTRQSSALSDTVGLAATVSATGRLQIDSKTALARQSHEPLDIFSLEAIGSSLRQGPWSRKAWSRLAPVTPLATTALLATAGVGSDSAAGIARAGGQPIDWFALLTGRQSNLPIEWPRQRAVGWTGQVEAKAGQARASLPQAESIALLARVAEALADSSRLVAKPGSAAWSESIIALAAIKEALADTGVAAAGLLASSVQAESGLGLDRRMVGQAESRAGQAASDAVHADWTTLAQLLATSMQLPLDVRSGIATVDATPADWFGHIQGRLSASSESIKLLAKVGEATAEAVAKIAKASVAEVDSQAAQIAAVARELAEILTQAAKASHASLEAITSSESVLAKVADGSIDAIVSQQVTLAALADNLAQTFVFVARASLASEALLGVAVEAGLPVDQLAGLEAALAAFSESSLLPAPKLPPRTRWFFVHNTSTVPTY